MFEPFSVPWIACLILICSIALLGFAITWYRFPRWWAKLEFFTEPELSQAEEKRRAILAQILGAPALVIGLGSAIVAIVSGVSSYKLSVQNEFRANQVAEEQKLLNFDNLFKDSIVNIAKDETPALVTASAYSLNTLLEAQKFDSNSKTEENIRKRNQARTILTVLQSRIRTLPKQKNSSMNEPSLQIVQPVLQATFQRDVMADFAFDLRGGNFSQVFINLAVLNNSNLSDVNFDGSTLYHASMHNDLLNNASFKGATLNEADLSRDNNDQFMLAYLSRAQFSPGRNTTTYDAGMGMQEVRTMLGGANLTNACGVNVNFWAAVLDHANLNDAAFSDAVFDHASLQRTSLRHLAIMKSSFVDAYLQESQFGATVESSDTSDTHSDLFKVNFQGAHMAGANLFKVHGLDLNFEGADLTDVNFQEAELRGTSFKNANLLRANLKQSTITDDDLKGAHLCQTVMPNGSISSNGCSALRDMPAQSQVLPSDFPMQPTDFPMQPNAEKLHFETQYCTIRKALEGLLTPDALSIH